MKNMRKIFVYLLGILTGFLLTIMVAYIRHGDREYEFFDQPGEIYQGNSFTVLQALDNGRALATDDDAIGRVVLLYNEEGTPYYDDQNVTAPWDKNFRHIGIYRYKTVKNIQKTVPIIAIFE